MTILELGGSFRATCPRSVLHFDFLSIELAAMAAIGNSSQLPWPIASVVYPAAIEWSRILISL